MCSSLPSISSSCPHPPLNPNPDPVPNRARSPASSSEALSLSRRLPSIPQCWRTRTLRTLPPDPWLYRLGGPSGIEAFTYVQYMHFFLDECFKNESVTSKCSLFQHFRGSPWFPSSPPTSFSRFFEFVV
ncbi:hypothetical protein QQF64_035552 [Cirrhinus molitorella]|uniref:Uncharacterized protein n=1 Tax=Cirrhinus molitorella TaxID=172907 RepID=A0ABR3NG74_9TELE